MNELQNRYSPKKGPFWLICEPDITDNITHGKLLSFPVLQSQATPSHKDIWNLCKGTIKNPWNYYPRGRVEIKRGKAVIYANSRCFECADLSEQLGSAFNLGELPLNFKADNSTHYTEGVFGKYRYEPTTERSKHEHHKKIKRNNF